MKRSILTILLLLIMLQASFLAYASTGVGNLPEQEFTVDKVVDIQALTALGLKLVSFTITTHQHIEE